MPTSILFTSDLARVKLLVNLARLHGRVKSAVRAQFAGSTLISLRAPIHVIDSGISRRVAHHHKSSYAARSNSEIISNIYGCISDFCIEI